MDMIAHLSDTTGQVLSAEQMEPFLVQAYFKPYLIKIVRKMVRWTDTHPDLLKRQSWLSSNHIPDQFVNRPFSVLIYAMMAAGALPVALYRSGKTTGSTLVSIAYSLYFFALFHSLRLAICVSHTARDYFGW